MPTNFVSTIFCQKTALHLNPKCAEAMDALLAAHLRPAEQAQLLQSLRACGAFQGSLMQWMEPVLVAAFGATLSDEERFQPLAEIRLLNNTLLQDPDICTMQAESRFHNRNVLDSLLPPSFPIVVWQTNCFETSWPVRTT